MTTENPTLDSEPVQTGELNEAFEVLADPCRRTVVTELEPGSTMAVDELAERVADRRESLSPRRAKVALAHNHLPRLDETGVVSFDRTTRTLEMNDAPRLRSILSAVTERS